VRTAGSAVLGSEVCNSAVPGAGTGAVTSSRGASGELAAVRRATSSLIFWAGLMRGSKLRTATKIVTTAHAKTPYRWKWIGVPRPGMRAPRPAPATVPSDQVAWNWAMTDLDRKSVV